MGAWRCVRNVLRLSIFAGCPISGRGDIEDTSCIASSGVRRQAPRQPDTLLLGIGRSCRAAGRDSLAIRQPTNPVRADRGASTDRHRRHALVLSSHDRPPPLRHARVPPSSRRTRRSISSRSLGAHGLTDEPRPIRRGRQCSEQALTRSRPPPPRPAPVVPPHARPLPNAASTTGVGRRHTAKSAAAHLLDPCARSRRPPRRSPRRFRRS